MGGDELSAGSSITDVVDAELDVVSTSDRVAVGASGGGRSSGRDGAVDTSKGDSDITNGRCACDVGSGDGGSAGTEASRSDVGSFSGGEGEAASTSTVGARGRTVSGDGVLCASSAGLGLDNDALSGRGEGDEFSIARATEVDAGILGEGRSDEGDHRATLSGARAGRDGEDAEAHGARDRVGVTLSGNVSTNQDASGSRLIRNSASDLSSISVGTRA